MTWVTIGHGYDHAFREIEKQRDRGAGIIAAVILQEHLIEAIKTRLDAKSSIIPNLFKSSGALGSFAAQIDLGLALGLYSATVHKLMHEVRIIRNEFAHNPHPASFRSQRERCARFMQSRTATRSLNASLPKSLKANLKTNIASSSKNPRRQFLSGVKTMTAMLTLQTAMSRYATEWERQKDGPPRPKRETSPDK